MAKITFHTRKGQRTLQIDQPEPIDLGQQASEPYDTADDLIAICKEQGYDYRTPAEGDAAAIFSRPCPHCDTWGMNAIAMEPPDGSAYVLIGWCMNCNYGELV